MQASRVEQERYSIFNRRDRMAAGWYWLLVSSELRRGAVRPVSIAGHELAVYRGMDGVAAALDAYCPHMGAHLAEGRVEEDKLRCFFHNWCFNREGECVDIPCTPAGRAPRTVATRAWHVSEKHGLVWVWLGDGKPDRRVPEPPELASLDFVYSVGNRFIKACHPNVVMVNAIDEQHFRTVHRLPGEILSMEPQVVSPVHIAFRNTGRAPGKLLQRLYRGRLTYDLDYWNGSTGTVTLGPDCLRMYLMFALRMRADGTTEGVAVAFAPRRGGIVSGAMSWLVMQLTKLAGLYFALGDTRVFQTIKFDLKTPIPADRAVLAFIQHLEQQENVPV